MITEGLGDYAIIRSSLSLILIVVFVCLTIYYLIYCLRSNYQYSQGIIYTVQDNNSSSNNIIKRQKLNYKADIIYDILLPLQQNNIPYNNGNVSVYYPKNTPSIYSLSYNPTYISEFVLCVCCFIMIATIIWIYILFTNPGLAAVSGGLDAAGDVSRMFFRR